MSCCPEDFRDIFGGLLDAANLHSHGLALPMILRELVQFRELHASRIRQATLMDRLESEQSQLKLWEEKIAIQLMILTRNVSLFRKYAEESLFPNNDDTLIAIRNELEARGLIEGVARPEMIMKKINGRTHTWIGRGAPESDDGKWVRQKIRWLPDATSSQ